MLKLIAGLAEKKIKYNLNKILSYAPLVLALLYVVARAYRGGSDIDHYLEASRGLFNGKNIYEAYLYSPFFALLLRPLSIFDLNIGRIIWAIINFSAAIRLYMVSRKLVEGLISYNKIDLLWWTIGIVIISAGFLNHNFILGQITILILWLTMEGLYQVVLKEKNISGALLLAVAVSIKIIPIAGLFYLFLRGKFKALVFVVIFFIATLFIPSLFVGHTYNMKMLNNWTNTIHPANEKYVFEQSNGTQSLNALLPAYFYDFGEKIDSPVHFNRTITSVPHNTLLIILQITRVLLLLSLLFVIHHRSNKHLDPAITFFREFAYLALVTVLIFPHQQTYAMLYIVPAGAYMILFSILAFRTGWKIRFHYKVIVIISLILLGILSVMGRDIVGDRIVDLFSYYHLWGIMNLIFITFLQIVKPWELLKLSALIHTSKIEE
ncbi:MAG: DUF2029 domain-containing protein [Bacteroidales bacterium]|nr:DUF2029 domain-containing protein [Bacteroidales bacterium]